MTRFTDSPYERMMTRRPEGGKETSRHYYRQEHKKDRYGGD